MKKFRSLLVLFLMAFFVLCGIIYWRVTSLSRTLPLIGNKDFTEQSVVIDGLKFTFRSSSPKIRFKPQSLNQEVLKKLLTRVGVIPVNESFFYISRIGPNNRPIKYSTLKEVIVDLREMNRKLENGEYDPTLITTTATYNQRVTEYHYGSIHDGVLTIPLYVDVNLSKKFQLPSSIYFSIEIIQAFHILQTPITAIGQNPFEGLFEKVGPIQEPILGVEVTTNQVNFFESINYIAEKIHNFIAPPAYAIVCNPGTAQCGTASQDCGKCVGDPTYGGWDRDCCNDFQCAGAGDRCMMSNVCSNYKATTCYESCYAGCESTPYCATQCNSICTQGMCNSSTCYWLPYGECTGPCGNQFKERQNSCGGTPLKTSCVTEACQGGGSSCDFDTVCESGESCSTCVTDCGSCGGGSCTPSCPTSCGQANGCGGSCGSGSGGIPGTPTIISPTSGQTLTPDTNNRITVSWNSVAKADYYQVQVYPTGTLPGLECTVSDSYCTTTSSTTFTFTLTGSETDFTWRVRAVNNTCSASDIGAWTAATSFYVAGTISGNFYLDTDGIATLNGTTGLCEGGATGQNPGAGSTIIAQWGGGTTTPGTIGGSAYSITGVGYDPNTLVTLSPDTSQWSCSCPAGCSYSGLSVPAAGVNFFLTNVKPSWWQTINGLVYAGSTAGSAVKTSIPNTCSGASCTPALLRNDDYDTANSSGFVVTGGGDIDTTYDTTTTLSYLKEGGTTERVGGAQFSGIREDYTYFSQLYSIGQSPTVDFSGSKPSSPPANPPSAAVADRAYYANGDVTINNPWTVNSGEKIVVFVNGNLNVNAQISVASGGFLAFITKGNITFDSSLGTASTSSTDAVVEGVFIADGQITFEGDAAGAPKFVGEGSFIGWGGVNFARSFASVNDNNFYPTELLRFRPDFIVNVPEKMTRPLYLWQETN